MHGTRKIAVFLTAITLLTGCASLTQKTSVEDKQPAAGTNSQTTHAQTDHVSGKEVEHHPQLEDFEETTASRDVLPKFLDKLEPRIKQSYKNAAYAYEELKFIPCYCGCGISEHHKDNADCFIKQINPDGTVVWVDHGTRCDTCMGIANMTAEMKQQDKSKQAIRDAVDEKYKEGYATPTKTPMP